MTHTSRHSTPRHAVGRPAVGLFCRSSSSPMPCRYDSSSHSPLLGWQVGISELGYTPRPGLVSSIWSPSRSTATLEGQIAGVPWSCCIAHHRFGRSWAARQGHTTITARLRKRYSMLTPLAVQPSPPGGQIRRNRTAGSPAAISNSAAVAAIGLILWLASTFPWFFVFPLCGFSLSLFCTYLPMVPQNRRQAALQRPRSTVVPVLPNLAVDCKPTSFDCEQTANLYLQKGQSEKPRRERMTHHTLKKIPCHCSCSS